MHIAVTLNIEMQEGVDRIVLRNLEGQDEPQRDHGEGYRDHEEGDRDHEPGDPDYEEGDQKIYMVTDSGGEKTFCVKQKERTNKFREIRWQLKQIVW